MEECRHLISKDSLKYRKISDGIYRTNMHIILNGIEVFNFSLREVVPNIKATLEYAGKTLNDYDYLVFHQANRLINETLRKMLKVEKEKVPYSIHKYGNTSSASVPLTIISELQEEIKQQKDQVPAVGLRYRPFVGNGAAGDGRGGCAGGWAVGRVGQT